MHRLGRVPPAETEADYCATAVRASQAGHATEVCIKPGRFIDNAPLSLLERHRAAMAGKMGS